MEYKVKFSFGEFEIATSMESMEALEVFIQDAPRLKSIIKPLTAEDVKNEFDGSEGKRVYKVNRDSFQKRYPKPSDVPKKIECPVCGDNMYLRTVVKKGRNEGREFYSCTNKTCNKFEWVT